METAEINYSIFETLFDEVIMNYDDDDSDEVRRSKLSKKKHKQQVLYLNKTGFKSVDLYE